MEEESEACYYKDLDVDVAVPYIDEKLQSVLGHFQKDFEGLVLADKLEAKYGEYGTFLPTHQISSSVISHPKTPPGPQNYIKSVPPKYLQVEGAPEKSTVTSDVYVPLSSSKLPNTMSQRTLKVRIKVGSSNKTQKNNTKIYSDEVNGAPLEKSPICIIQDMNIFPVGAGVLFSPLHESFLCLVRKENTVRPKLSAALGNDLNSMSANEKVSRQNRMDFNKKLEVGNMKSKQCLSSELKLKALPDLKERRIDRSWYTENFSSCEEKDDQNSSVEKIKESGKSKSIKISISSKTYSDLSMCGNYSKTGSVDHVQQKVAPKVNINVPHSTKKMSLGCQKKSNRIKNNGKLGSESEKPQNDVQKVAVKCKDALDIRLQQRNTKMNLLKRPFCDSETAKEKETPSEELGLVGPENLQYWVCCDSCQTWRLLPFGTKPDQLPDKWLCTMIDWLPGMNRCDISEEETTKALNALYRIPLPESQNKLQSQNNQRQNLDSNATPNQGKKNKSETIVSNLNRKRLVSKREPNQNAYNTKKIKTESAYSKDEKLKAKDISVIPVRRKGKLEDGSHHTLDDVDIKKNVLGSKKFSMTAVSSCSKVFGSSKRDHFQKAKDSPVGSVSSSPSRNFSLGNGNFEKKRSTHKDLSSPIDVKHNTSHEAATSLLREAQDLVNSADHLKESGCDECNETYFKAAQKFLLGASLLEASKDGTREYDEITRIQLYRNAANLCKTCALEYEKREETAAAAALAYKCMEVALMRVVYCKSLITKKDQNDLQASLQIVPQGESPSSSLSCVDNLNNQAAVDKFALSNGMNSHAGNHIINARNRPNFVRILDFTSDVTSAMEASGKCQSAFGAANVILEEAHNKEGNVLMKRAINFSFQDVEEFVRLIHLATKAISPKGFSVKSV